MYLNRSQRYLGPKTAKTFESIPHSNNNVQRRIEDMAKDVKQQVIEEVKKSLHCAIQLNESTDVSNCGVLLCLARYKKITDVKEELLCSINLPGHTTGLQIF